MKKTKEEAITLIALIITVIVMLILAGVAINLIIGDNGIFKKSDEGARIYKNVANNETASLNHTDQEMGDLINQYQNGSDGGIMTDTPEPTVPVMGGRIEEVKGKEKFDDTTIITDKNGEKLTVPGGFRVPEDSADEVKKGIVIVDENGNEFVWVPVPDPTTMYTEETVTLSGVDVTTNRYSKLIIRSGDSNGYTEGKPGSTNSKDIKEPDILPDTTYGEFSSTGIEEIKNVLGIVGETDEEILKKYATSLVEEYNAMINSVIKYKGFYIGRYEITGTVDNPASKRGTPITSQNWYKLKKACSGVVNNQYVQSTMIYGCQ